MENFNHILIRFITFKPFLNRKDSKSIQLEIVSRKRHYLKTYPRSQIKKPEKGV